MTDTTTTKTRTITLTDRPPVKIREDHAIRKLRPDLFDLPCHGTKYGGDIDA